MSVPTLDELESLGRIRFPADASFRLRLFYPPLTGAERFVADGSDEASGPIEKTNLRMFVKRSDEMHQAGDEVVWAGCKARAHRK